MKKLIIKKKLLFFICIIFVFLGTISIFCVIYENSLHTRQGKIELSHLEQQLDEFYGQLTIYDETLSEVSDVIAQSDKNNGITLVINKDKSKMLASEIDKMVSDKVKKEVSNNMISADELNTLLQSEIQKIYESILNWNSDLSEYVLSEQEKEYIISATVKIVEEDLLKNIKDDSSKYLELEKAIKSNEDNISKILSDIGKIKDFSKDIDQTNARIDLLELAEGDSSNEILNQLNELQKLLTSYADAVKAGDEEARKKLQAELEEYSKGLDKATREHIEEILNSTEENIDEKLLALQKQLNNNSSRIDELDVVQDKLQKYAEAVKAEDEEARKKLQAELEEYSKGLDDATRKHIKEVIDSTTDDIDEKLDAANQSIADLEAELTNSITENSTAIAKDKSDNLSDINAIIADLQKLIENADKDADRAKYEAALKKIAEKKDGVWTPIENVTPTKALSVYNSVINETKIENRITEVSNNIDSNMMKAEFSADGSTLTITVPSDN